MIPEWIEKNNEFGLSTREVEVLHKLALGLRNQDIAKALYLSEGTVKNYISNIYSKLNVKGRREAADKARETGILDS
ncbi:response regulator transcription factor [Paenibacillus chibensis]|uniref:response regulator transcription factor n=1 Tax=Paenibacillus chibensis TaxID=59846 RepID=UPI001580DEFB|nr:response regulator transcription factor [Paenibacillus chibensis]MEC0371115.1 response regulator transcription factor [Paenibacillus chibensis]